jgi:NAD(P)H-dependent FMN reductase
MGSEPLYVLGVIGSPRSDSISAAFVNAALRHAGALGAETRLLDLRETPLPLFDPVGDVADPVVEQATALVRRADAFVLGTPDYHGAPSGTMKNFLDHFWKELAGKLFGIAVASNEKGLTVQEHLRTSIRQCYGWSLPYGVGAPSSSVSAACEVADPKVLQRLEMLARDLVVYGTLLRDQRLRDLASPRDPLQAGFMARMHLD